MREQIEKRYSEKTIEQAYKDVFKILESIVGKKPHEQSIDEFEKLVEQGKFAPQSLRSLRELVSARKEFKKGKMNVHKVHKASRDAMVLINELVEYNQRCEIANHKK